MAARHIVSLSSRRTMLLLAVANMSSVKGKDSMCVVGTVVPSVYAMPA